MRDKGNIDGNQVLTLNEVEKAIKLFIKLSFTFKKILSGATKTPWIDGERRESMRKRDKLAAIDRNGIEKW